MKSFVAIQIRTSRDGKRCDPACPWITRLPVCRLFEGGEMTFTLLALDDRSRPIRCRKCIRADLYREETSRAS